jgi:hypothetical protein
MDEKAEFTYDHKNQVRDTRIIVIKSLASILSVYVDKILQVQRTAGNQAFLRTSIYRQPSIL